MITLKGEGGHRYAVIIRPKTTLTTSCVDDVPKEVQVLLNKYQDIVVDEILNALPPMRDVSHHIDLILGVPCPVRLPMR